MATPRGFGRDGISGMLTADRAVRARHVSQPTAEDVAAAADAVAAALERLAGQPRRR